MTVRLRVDAPHLDLDLAVPAGAAVDLTPVGVAGSEDVATARVAWLAGYRGPWRRRSLLLDGRPLGYRRAAARVRAGVVAVAPPVLAAEVSIRDHLAAAAPVARVDAVLAQVPRLRGRGDEPAGVLSGGERQMVAWARATLVAPRVLVLDRAATGLDGETFAWASAQVAAWRSAGCVVLVRVGRPDEAVWLAEERPSGRSGGHDG